MIIIKTVIRVNVIAKMLYGKFLDSDVRNYLMYSTVTITQITKYTACYLWQLISAVHK